MLREFKTARCNLQGAPASHDHRCCPFYHNERDRRRAAVAEGAPAYAGEQCPDQFDDQRACPRGDACGMCHSTAELLYHPDFFRKRLCHQSGQCPRGRYCAFAHARQELLVPHFGEAEESEPTEEFIIHRFKTQWCPVGGPHDWEACVYAHTYRDWRRAPSLGYSSHPCPRWAGSVSGGSAELSYAERCPNGFACPLAHGAKEQLYHPQFYKAGPCSDSNCRRGPLCAFTHGEPPLARGEDPRPSAARKPIPNAEELLQKCQPTFGSAPMYHALDEATKAGCGGPRARAQRRARGGGPAARGQTGAPSAFCTMTGAIGQQQMAARPYPLPQVPFPSYFHMVSVADPVRSSLGTRGCPLGGPMGGRLGPVGCAQVGHSVGTLGCPTSFPVSMSPAFPLGAPPYLLAQPMQPMATAVPHAVLPAPPQPRQAEDGGEHEFPPLPGSAFLEQRLLGGGAPDPGKSGLVDLASWRHRYAQKESGWRTPSSFGSPPLSGVQTASTSPRNTAGGGAWKSWGPGAADLAAADYGDSAAASEGPPTPRATAARYCAPSAR